MQLEDGLSLNSTVALKLEDSSWGYYSWEDSSWLNALFTVKSQNLCELNLRCTLNEEYVKQLSEIVTTCKQLQVLKVILRDNSESFFHVLSEIKACENSVSRLLVRWQYCCFKHSHQPPSPL